MPSGRQALAGANLAGDPDRPAALALGSSCQSACTSRSWQGPEDNFKGVTSKTQCFLEAKKPLLGKTGGWSLGSRGLQRSRGPQVQVEASVGKWGV